MMRAGRSGKRCFTFCSRASPEVPGMRMSETSTWGAPLESRASIASFACAKVLKGMPSRASAFSNTQRMERSSSMTQTGLIDPSAKRQHYAETGPSRLAFALDHALVLLDEGLRKRQAKPGSAFAARDQRVEDLVADFRRNPRPVIHYLQF